MYEEQVNALRRLRDWSVMDFEDNLSYANQIAEEAADVIEELTKPRWIPVTERLPEENGNYLVAVKCPRGKWVEICACDGRDWVSVDEYAEYATKWVTHWMPLPEPPKEE